MNCDIGLQELIPVNIMGNGISRILSIISTISEMSNGIVLIDSGNLPNNIAKARSQVFLAAMPDIVNSVGLGAKKNYWDFNSSVMSELKTFINRLKD